MDATETLPRRDLDASPTPACPATQDELARRAEEAAAIAAWAEYIDWLASMGGLR